MNFPRGEQQNHFKTILQFRNSRKRKREKSNKNWLNLNSAFSSIGNNWSKVLKSARNCENHILHFMQWAPAKCVWNWIDMFIVQCTLYTLHIFPLMTYIHLKYLSLFMFGFNTICGTSSRSATEHFTHYARTVSDTYIVTLCTHISSPNTQ